MSVWDASRWDAEIWIGLATFVLAGLGRIILPWLKDPDRRFRLRLRRYRRWFARRNRNWNDPEDAEAGTKTPDNFVRLSVVDVSAKDAVGMDAFGEFDKGAHPKSSRNLLILGRPGSGKSTLLRAYGLDQVRLGGLSGPGGGPAGRLIAWLRRRRQPHRVPLLLDLARFAEILPDDLARHHARDRLIKYLEEMLEEAGLGRAQDSEKKFLRRALQTHRVDLLLDALDEVPPSKRGALLRVLRDFTTSRDSVIPSANARLLVTCRTENFEAIRPSWDLRFAELHLVPLRDSEIADYLRRTDPDRWDRVNIQKLLEARRADQTIEYIRYPLILSRTVDSFDPARPVSSSIIDFYSAMVRGLLDGTYKQSADQPRLETGEMLEVMRRLADRNARGLGGVPFQYFTRDDLRDVCEERRGRWSQTFDDRQLEACVDILLGRSGLITRAGLRIDDESNPARRTPLFYFAHKTFQEYLVGVQLATDDPQAGADLLLENVGSDGWQLITRYYCAHLGQLGQDVDQFLNALYDKASPPGDRRDDGDPEASWRQLAGLTLAGRCLAWSKASNQSAYRITAGLHELLKEQVATLLAAPDGEPDASPPDIRDRRLAAIIAAIEALLSGLRSPRQGVRNTIKPIAEDLVGTIDQAMARGLDLQPEAIVTGQMIDGITELLGGQAVHTVARLIRSAPQHIELVGPLWRCLNAYGAGVSDEPAGETADEARVIVERLLTLAMRADGFDELAAQPYLRRANGNRYPGQTLPGFMTPKLIREAYPFAHALPRDSEVHPLVGLLCWAWQLKAKPSTTNRLIVAMITATNTAGPISEYARVEADWRRTSRAIPFWVARTWSTLALLLSIAGWAVLFTDSSHTFGPIQPWAWIGALGAVAAAAILYALVTWRSVKDDDEQRPKRRWFDAGAVPGQQESGSVIPEYASRLLPASVAQIVVVVFALPMTIPAYFLIELSDVEFATAVLAVALLVIWVPALQAFDHGRRTLSRNRYLDIYTDADSVLWVARPGSQPQELKVTGDPDYISDSMRSWLVDRRSTVFNGFVIVALLLGLLLFRDNSIEPAAITVIVSGVLLVALTQVYVRAFHLDGSTVPRLLLMLVGGLSLFTGLLLMAYGGESLGIGDVTGLGAAAVIGGALVLYSAMQLRNEFDQRVPLRRPVESAHRSSGRHTVALRRYQASGTSGGIERQVDICIGKLDLLDLHYLAVHDRHGIRFSVDLLEYPELQRFANKQISADMRRRQYFGHGPRVNRLVSRFNEQFRKIESGDLLRVVLDVERGALYYFKVADPPNETFIIGVTLDQNQVHLTDRKIVALVTELRAALGLPRLEELEGPFWPTSDSALADDPAPEEVNA